ncbi:TetR/AcrR family transcriptional regulator [Plantactinospora sp. GCM10030261]|uniref:TetR/AcrR family transcriptional regulator n=1 Tax=Plantactinospora sp. GCM10030261 TaxID=3273420 RepID=UPI003610A8D4
MERTSPSTGMRRPLLPVLGQEPVERADAARNRRKILDAAARLMARDGCTALSLDEVARAAGVGVGTVYRRFGDRGRLIAALINDREIQFQTAVLSGPPPLGPGAPPDQRIRAFLHAMYDRIEEQLDLFLLAEKGSPSGWYRFGPHQLRHAHLALLLADVAPGVDAHYLADAMLAALAPSMIDHQRRGRGYSGERIKAGLDTLVAAICAGADRCARG